jgi:hypothetical protein
MFESGAAREARSLRSAKANYSNGMIVEIMRIRSSENCPKAGCQRRKRKNCCGWS